MQLSLIHDVVAGAGHERWVRINICEQDLTRIGLNALPALEERNVGHLWLVVFIKLVWDLGCK